MRAFFSSLVLGFALLAWTAASGTTRYVSPGGSHTPPFTNWAQAATNFLAAVSASGDGDEVVATNGYYRFEQVVPVTKGITVRSVNGAAVTFIDGILSNAAFSARHRDAALDGFTMTRCQSAMGGAVFLDGGAVVRNCVITNNSASFFGGGVYANLECSVSNCVIRDNSVLLDGDGGGIYAFRGARIESCVIVSNRARTGGGVVMMYKGTLRNCLVAGNAATQAGGVLLSQGSRVVNCTVADNSAQAAGGVDLFLGGQVMNSIVYDNAAARGTNWMVHSSADNAGSFLFSCTVPLPSGDGNTNAAPNWVNRAAGNYRLGLPSPCVDTASDAMAPATDLDQQARPQDGDSNGPAHADMGAYERLP